MGDAYGTYTPHASCQGDGFAHYLSLEATKTDPVCCVFCFFSPSETEATGNLKAVDTLLISPSFVDVSPQASQGADDWTLLWLLLVYELCQMERASTAKAATPARRSDGVFATPSNQNVRLKGKLLSFLRVWLRAPPAAPPLRWQDGPVSQTPLAGVGVGVRVSFRVRAPPTTLLARYSFYGHGKRHFSVFFL